MFYTSYHVAQIFHRMHPWYQAVNVFVPVFNYLTGNSCAIIIGYIGWTGGIAAAFLHSLLIDVYTNTDRSYLLSLIHGLLAIYTLLHHGFATLMVLLFLSEILFQYGIEVTSCYRRYGGFKLRDETEQRTLADQNPTGHFLV
jgi:hypothetical protein